MSSERWRPVIRRLIERRSSLDDVLKRGLFEAVLRRFENGDRRHSQRVWLLLWYQIWDGLFVSKIFNPHSKLSELAG